MSFIILIIFIKLNIIWMILSESSLILNVHLYSLRLHEWHILAYFVSTIFY
jgi:hypothetical protein